MKKVFKLVGKAAVAALATLVVIEFSYEARGYDPFGHKNKISRSDAERTALYSALAAVGTVGVSRRIAHGLFLKRAAR